MKSCHIREDGHNHRPRSQPGSGDRSKFVHTAWNRVVVCCLACYRTCLDRNSDSYPNAYLHDKAVNIRHGTLYTSIVSDLFTVP